MTIEELKKIPLHYVCHLNMGDVHTTTYASEDNRIGICDHVRYKNGVPHGKSYRHWRIDNKVYKKWDDFVKALNDIQL